MCRCAERFSKIPETQQQGISGLLDADTLALVAVMLSGAL
jgi:hypothetical protein